MVHEGPVLSLDFADSDKLMLASGDAKGIAKVWKAESGKLLRQIDIGYSISVLRFQGNTQLLAAC